MLLSFHWQYPVIFQNTNSHSHWEHMRIPVVQCTHQLLISLELYIFTSLMRIISTLVTTQLQFSRLEFYFLPQKKEEKGKKREEKK